jgi:hypothetical protein
MKKPTNKQHCKKDKNLRKNQLNERIKIEKKPKNSQYDNNAMAHT